MANYWDKRQATLAKSLERDEARLKKRLAALYKREAASLERDIASYYQRYGVDQVIEYRVLMDHIDPLDAEMLMKNWDEFARLHPEYAHLAPVRESIYKLNRLEGLQSSIRLQQCNIGAVEQGMVSAHLSKHAVAAAKAAVDYVGTGSYNPELATTLIDNAWSGTSFSDSIWSNKQKLSDYLGTDFAQGVARGLNYDQMASALSMRFGKVSKRDAYRLIYTEGTYVMNEAQAKAWEQDFTYYRLSVARESDACQVCLDIQAAQRDNPVRFADREPGRNFPPLHPWCRCKFEIADEEVNR